MLPCVKSDNPKKRKPVARISAKRLAALGGKVPFSTIARSANNPKRRKKSIRRVKAFRPPLRPIPGALDPRSHYKGDGREKLYGVDKTARRRELFERSGGRCEEMVYRPKWSMSGRVVISGSMVRCEIPIVFEDDMPNSMEWSHKKHGSRKTDTLEGGIASCKECHRRRHGQ